MQLRVYTGADGQSHFDELALPDQEIFQYALKSGETLDFRRENMKGWHNPPRRQYVIHLEGAAEIEISDGTKKIMRPGDMVLMEDMTGPGHTTTPIERPWLIATVALADQTPGGAR